ncbi:TIGR02302 family protein [Gemmobacter megaterium]|uniref:TIGR02302 family protein n=1 Tax=Gemmobacter megaterium TaxID=1086013 RepID=A0A1N7PHV2_9RHOB|nr:DUF4175 domain-containing protein [Gemmobacter megaterium]GGE18158.1 ATPase [Gemmobacter megaterium]SIT10158.1 TIGR02302 family protein [Gemmobacter megaterium]
MKRTDQTRNLTLWRLRWQIRLTWAGLLAERIVRAFWPVWSILLAVYAGLALGLTERLPQVWFNGLGIAAAVLALGFAVRGLRGLRLPSRAQAMARLDATLPGRPLAALTDTQAIGSGEVWQAHVARMSDRAAKARAPVPDVRLNARDPYALRYTALLLALVALGFGSTGRLAGIAGVGPQGAQALAVGPVWEGWVRPPGYTGKPALYLNDITAEGLELPQGSRVILRFYGEAGALGVDESVSGAPLEQTAAQGAEFTVERHGRIEITGPNGRGWDIGVLRDLPPTIAATATPEREADGRMKLPFTASDDYGVVAGRAQIALDLPEVDRRHGLAAAPEPREPVVLDLPLPFTGSRTEIMETLLDDLSKHPFANLPVQIRLSAEDAPGQSGEAEPLATILPGKRFFDPLAAAVAEARRDILWTAENAVRAAQILRAVTHLPENFIRNERAFLRLRVAIRQLEGAMTPELRDQLSDELWEIALLMEQGDLASALERLKRAQDRLDEAMKNGASESEIAELMQELRDALDNYMRQLAQEADRAPDQQMSDMQGMQMTGDQLQQLLDKLQELMEQGRMAEAQELMEMLRQLMENMQVTQGQGGQGDGQGRMRDLADTLREQQGLSDEAFRDMQEGMDRNMGRQPGSQGEQGQGEQGEGEGEQGRGGQGQGREGAEGGEGQGGERGLADRQRDLRNRLRALGQAEMPGEGSERGQAGRQALDRAGRAMEGAEQALRDGDTPRALDRQAEAMEALREGMREFGEAMAEERRERGGDGPGEQFGEGDPRGQRDPLGRDPSGRNLRGPTEGGPLADGEDPYRRALDLLQELRRRSGDLGRSEDERDYLRRLLDQF